MQLLRQQNVWGANIADRCYQLVIRPASVNVIIDDRSVFACERTLRGRIRQTGKVFIEIGQWLITLSEAPDNEIPQDKAEEDGQ